MTGVTLPASMSSFRTTRSSFPSFDMSGRRLWPTKTDSTGARRIWRSKPVCERNPIGALTTPFAGRPPCGQTARMLSCFRYRLLRGLLRLLMRCGVDQGDLEAALLRHQLRILARGGSRPLFTPADRAFLAAAARLLATPNDPAFRGGRVFLRPGLEPASARKLQHVGPSG